MDQNNVDIVAQCFMKQLGGATLIEFAFEHTHKHRLNAHTFKT